MNRSSLLYLTNRHPSLKGHLELYSYAMFYNTCILHISALPMYNYNLQMQKQQPLLTTIDKLYLNGTVENPAVIAHLLFSNVELKISY